MEFIIGEILLVVGFSLAGWGIILTCEPEGKSAVSFLILPAGGMIVLVTATYLIVRSFRVII